MLTKNALQLQGAIQPPNQAFKCRIMTKYGIQSVLEATTGNIKTFTHSRLADCNHSSITAIEVIKV